MNRSSMKSGGVMGFTLIELLVVIAIIGFLSAMLFVVLGGMLRNGKTAASSSNLMQIGQMVQMYLGDNQGEFPTARGISLGGSQPGVSEVYWRRQVWEHVHGYLGVDAASARDEMRSSAYGEIMWCPLQVGKYGKEEHEWGRGSYSINHYFRDPEAGGYIRFEGEYTLIGVKEPMIAAGNQLESNPEWGTDAFFLSSSYPYIANDWKNISYEYGFGGDQALAMFVDGSVRRLPQEAGIALNDLIEDGDNFD